MSIQYLFIHIHILYTYVLSTLFFSWKFQGLPPWDRIVKDFEKYDCGAFVRSKTAGNHMLLALEATQFLEDKHDRVVFQCPVEVSSVCSAFFPLARLSHGHAVASKTKPSFNQCHATVHEQIVLEMCRESADFTWHGISSANQIKASNFGCRISILHTNLELGPWFHTHIPKSFCQLTILNLFSDLARRYICTEDWWASCTLFPSMWPPMARTCGRPWQESTFQNMVHEQFAPVKKSQQLFKFLETFLEQIRWCHCSSFSLQVRQRKFFNRLVNSSQTVHSLRPFCLWGQCGQCLDHVTKV